MKLFCYGDSNTYGYDPRSFLGDRYSSEVRWTSLLQRETGWVVVNSGLNGREIPHTSWQMEQFDRLLALYPDFDLLAVMLGGNDLLQNGSFTAVDVAGRMEGFLRHLCKKLPSASLLLLAPPPMRRGAWVTEERLLRESALLGPAYAALASRLGVPFADSGQWNIELVFDGVHFSEKGHRAFAEGMRLHGLHAAASF